MLVVYSNQLLDAVLTQKLVEILFESRFQPFLCFFTQHMPTLILMMYFNILFLESVFLMPIVFLGGQTCQTSGTWFPK